MTTPLILPPEDLYIFQCVGVQDKFSTVSGKEYKLLSLRIAEGPYTGNVLFRAIIDSDQAAFIWDSWVDSIEDDLIGMFAFARIRHEEYMSIPRASVGQLFKVPKELLGSYITDTAVTE